MESAYTRPLAVGVTGGASDCPRGVSASAGAAPPPAPDALPSTPWLELATQGSFAECSPSGSGERAGGEGAAGAAPAGAHARSAAEGDLEALLLRDAAAYRALVAQQLAQAQALLGTAHGLLRQPLPRAVAVGGA